MAVQLSTACAEITPTAYTWMAGFATPREATGTNAPLMARALVLWNGEAPKALVSVDAVGFGRAWYLAIRPRLLALASWTAADIVLLATHTHSGPATEYPDPYISYGATDPTPAQQHGAWLADRIVALLTQALAAPRTTVTLDYRTTTQAGSYNRAGLSYVENTVPVLVARAGDRPKAILYGWGTHPVAGATVNEWDGDYPGAASRAIEAVIPGCVALFIPGAAGDQDPSGTRGPALRDTLGAQLASAVLTACATSGRTLSYPAATAADHIANLDLSAGLPAMRAAYVTRLAAALPYYRRHAERMIAAINAGTHAASVTIPITVWKFPGAPMLRWLFAGAEMCSGWAVYYRNLYGVAGVNISGYANSIECYGIGNEFFPPFHPTGSYEGGWDADAPSVAGGALTVYGAVGHLKYGVGNPASFEATMLAAQNALLSGG